MADPAPALAPTPALAGASAGRFGPASTVVLETLPEPPMTQLIAARGEDVDARLAGRVPAEDLRILGPGQRLALGVAAVAQTGSRGRIGLTGPGAATLLARGVGADLHESRFAVGASAPMLFGRTGVVLARTGPQAWEILVPRSYELSLWEELIEAGRSLGIEARGPGG